MHKKIVIIALITLAFIIIFLGNSNDYKNTNKKTSNIIRESIDYFNNTTLVNIDVGYFKDRYIAINNGLLSIGKNKNELDNGYYDVAFKVNNKNIEVYINKLFKDFNTDTICDEVYVQEIVKYIENIFNLKLDEKLFSNLIITNYENLRDVDRNKVENVDKVVSISNINIDIETRNNELLLKMGDIYE